LDAHNTFTIQNATADKITEPPVPKNRQTKTTAVSFRCTPEFRLRLAAAAAHEHRSQANFLERLLEEYCERTGLSVSARRPRAVETQGVRR
jgi:hypothetical protein